jgi:LCP family protein required for cell wall assembly
MTDLEVAFDQIARRGVARDPDDVVEAALNAAVPTRQVRSRRFGRVLLSAAAVLLVVTTAVAAYVRSRVDDIARVNVAGALSDDTPAAGEPTTMLIVGVDRPAGGNAQSVGRADVVMLAKFDPTAHTIAFLAIPRDTRVRIPGTDRDDRINTAFTEGPSQLIDAVVAVTGIRPDHYVEVDFAGFARLVDAVGGVALQFEAPMRDRLSGLEVDAGCQTLDGETALAFVRARHLEIRKRDGRYSVDPTGDLGRIQRQSQLINAALADFPAVAAEHPARLNQLFDAASSAVTLDSQLSIRSWLGEARALVRHPPARSFFVVPTTVVTIDDAVYLQVDAEQLADVVAAFSSPPKGEPTDGPTCHR